MSWTSWCSSTCEHGEITSQEFDMPKRQLIANRDVQIHNPIAGWFTPPSPSSTTRRALLQRRGSQSSCRLRRSGGCCEMVVEHAHASVSAEAQCQKPSTAAPRP